MNTFVECWQMIHNQKTYLFVSFASGTVGWAAGLLRAASGFDSGNYTSLNMLSNRNPERQKNLAADQPYSLDLRTREPGARWASMAPRLAFAALLHGCRLLLSRKILLLLALATLAACQPATPDSTADRTNAAAKPAPADPSPKHASGHDVHQRSTQRLQPPRPASVLYFISNVDGKGELSYEVANGSWINYWHGFQFELNGTTYYTGFAWETPELYGAERESHFPAPDTKVTLTHATFVASKPGSKTPWTWQGSELYIGEFGGHEKGNEIDPERKPQTWKTASGDMLLALPTWYLVSGVRMRTIDVLLFNPHELMNTDDKRWRYLATLEAGSNNDASCGPDSPGAIPCTNITGSLTFVPSNGSDLPTLRVTMPGADGQGNTVTEYRYDTGRKSYLPAT